MTYLRFSVIIPVYNRPDELEELLHSLSHQTSHDFEVIIVEDGSSVPCSAVFEKFQHNMPLSYHFKENTGPGPSRNFGAKYARGSYLLFFDSDCIIPPGYFETLDKALSENGVDFFGGPDRSHPAFTPIQKAISYAMTSFLTTGGIRGGKRKVDKFYPRSFNMGILREAFEKVGGFAPMRFGEDLDLSMRLIEAGYRSELLPDSWVYHKRRTDFRKFFRQVFNSGIARINLELKHPGTLKLVHALPSCFVAGCIAILVTGVFFPYALLLLALYGLMIFFDSLEQNQNFRVALLSIPASFVQLFGYGLGFLKAVWKRLILKKGEFKSFEKTFYK